MPATTAHPSTLGENNTLVISRASSRLLKVHYAEPGQRPRCGQAPAGVNDWRRVTCKLCLRRLPVLDQPWEPPAKAKHIGDGHYVQFVVWDPERHPEAPDPAGLIHWHPRPGAPADRQTNRERCGGVIFWWKPAAEQRPTWDLVSLDRIHVEPSLLCTPPWGCGSHGFIRDGRWVQA